MSCFEARAFGQMARWLIRSSGSGSTFTIFPFSTDTRSPQKGLQKQQAVLIASILVLIGLGRVNLSVTARDHHRESSIAYPHARPDQLDLSLVDIVFQSHAIPGIFRWKNPLSKGKRYRSCRIQYKLRLHGSFFRAHFSVS